MKCQNCGINESNVNLAMNFNNQKMQVHLCDSCFQEIQGQMINSNDFFKGSSFENNKYFNGQENKNTGTKTKEREKNKRDGLLDQLGNNISDEARAGNIDPVIGRDKEVKGLLKR